MGSPDELLAWKHRHATPGNDDSVRDEREELLKAAAKNNETQAIAQDLHGNGYLVVGQ